MRNRLRISIACLFVTIIGFPSCKKYTDPPRVFEKYNQDTSKDNGRNVLLISIDGVSGQVVKNLNPPHIAELINHGKYSYNVLPSYISTDASSWVTLMTGVSSGRHLIQDSSFVYDPEEVLSEDDNGAPNFPTFFNHIFPDHPEYKMSVITPWEDLSKYLTVVNHNITVNGDEEVKDSVISVLQTTPRPGVIVANFNGAEISGYKAGGFTADFIEYKTTILQIDEYIGDIMKALKQRDRYDKEDWLIMVTTNHGGSIENPKPGFIICSNPSFQKEEVKKVGFSAVPMTQAGDDATYATMNPIVDGKRVYDFQKDFTIQMDVNLSPDDRSTVYPYFFGNKWQLNGNNYPGFTMMYNYDPTWIFNATSGSKKQVTTDKAVVGDNNWHTIGFTVKDSSGTRKVTTYLDGEAMGEGDLPSGADLNSDFPVTIGWMPASDGNDYVKIMTHNIKLFDVALSSSDMKDNTCIEDYTQLNNFDQLTGFWACEEGNGGVFFNSINKNCPFVIHGNFEWTDMEETVPCSVTPSSLTGGNAPSIVPANSDVAANILYWLEIDIKPEWKLDGNPWLDNFETEFLK